MLEHQNRQTDRNKLKDYYFNKNNVELKDYYFNKNNVELQINTNKMFWKFY